MNVEAPAPLPPPHGCASCGARSNDMAGRFDLPIAMAFQPILDLKGRVFAHEALVRGADGAGAYTVLSHVSDRNRYTFDQLCRTTAIRRAAELGIVQTGALLSINFNPNAIYEPMRCISSSLAAARRFGIPNSSLMFEITEQERIVDPAHLKSIVDTYASLGFTVAIDDFGAGFANLDLLAEFLPDIVKLDMKLSRGIDGDRRRQIIVRNIVRMLEELDVAIVAEGIETTDEFDAIRDLGVGLFQGYLFAKPRFDAFAVPTASP